MGLILNYIRMKRELANWKMGEKKLLEYSTEKQKAEKYKRKNKRFHRSSEKI